MCDHHACVHQLVALVFNGNIKSADLEPVKTRKSTKQSKFDSPKKDKKKADDVERARPAVGDILKCMQEWTSALLSNDAPLQESALRSIRGSIRSGSCDWCLSHFLEQSGLAKAIGKLTTSLNSSGSVVWLAKAAKAEIVAQMKKQKAS